MFEPAVANPLSEAAAWLVAMATGPLAIILCTLAVAAVGLFMFGGRFPVRQGARVIMGCFILLGAPVIATALMELAQTNAAGSYQPIPEPTESPRGALPPSNYDPYAGASLRRD